MWGDAAFDELDHALDVGMRGMKLYAHGQGLMAVTVGGRHHPGSLEG